MRTKQLVPMVNVADVPRSIAYYGELGFELGNAFAPPDAGAPTWAWLRAGDAQLMVAKSGDPIVPDAPAVLFYLYADDVGAAHQELRAKGLNPGPISTPFYAPRGEFRLTDPDGYVLMVTHT